MSNKAPSDFLPNLGAVLYHWKSKIWYARIESREMDTAEYSITQCKQEKKSKARDQKINVTIINQNKCYMHALDVNLSYNECNKKK